MSEGGKRKGSLKSDIPKKPERTDQKLADIAGVGKGTIRNTETILTKGTPKDIKQVREAVVNA